MVLNAEYVRDVLLAIESFSLNERITMTTLGAKLPDIAEDDLWYTCIKLDEAGFLDMMTIPGQPLPSIKQIYCLTYCGHEFLNSVRDEKRWSKLKHAAAALGDLSLTALRTIAQGMTSAGITALFQHVDLP